MDRVQICLPVALLMFSFLSQQVFCETLFLTDFGGIVNDSSVEASNVNGEAFYNALATATEGDEIKILTNELYYFIPPPNTTAYGCNYVTLTIDGTIILNDDTSAWPMVDDGKFSNAIDIQQSQGFVFQGEGVIDGQGHTWWWEFVLGKIPRKRPTIINFDGCVGCSLFNITLKNGPRFHFYSRSTIGLEVCGVSIFVNVLVQRMMMEQMLGHNIDIPPFNTKHFFNSSSATSNHHNENNFKKNGKWWSNLPMFPLNTDGIDVEGVDIWIHNVTVNNYDDTVAIKPQFSPGYALGTYVNETRNVLVEDLIVIIGAGISVGSVPPNKDHPRVVNNVTFRNIKAYTPLKLAYIKTNPDSNGGKAYISNIVYDNVASYGTFVYPIYLGPQQQSEPDGTGNGVWPPTNPNVTITNITFKNFVVKSNEYVYPQSNVEKNKHINFNINFDVVGNARSSLLSGVLRCNVSNPCTNIVLENITIDRERGYICDKGDTVYGTYTDNVIPEPSCIIASSFTGE